MNYINSFLGWGNLQPLCQTEMNSLKPQNCALEYCEAPNYSSVDFSKITQKQFDCFVNPPKQIAQLSPSQFAAALDKTRCALHRVHVTDDQLKGLDYSKITKNQFNCFFGDSLAKRIALLSPTQLHNALDTQDCSAITNDITDDQLKKIDFNKLNVDQVDCLIDWNFKSYETDRTKRRLGLLPPTQIGPVVKKMPNNKLSLFSDEQFANLDFTKIPLCNFYPSTQGANTGLQRIEKLSLEKLSSLLDKLPCHALANYVSNEQFKKIDFTHVNRGQLDCLVQYDRKARIGMLSSQQLPSILDLMSCSSQHEYLSKQQIEGLNVTNLTKSQLSCWI